MKNTKIRFLKISLTFLFILSLCFTVNSQYRHKFPQDSTIYPPSSRTMLNDSIFNAVIVDGWTSLNQSNVTEYLIGSFILRYSESSNQRSPQMGETIDTTEYHYSLSVIGHTVSPPSYERRKIAFGSRCLRKIDNNFFELILVEGLMRNKLFIYGYLDNGNYLYIFISQGRVNFDSLDSEKHEWMKFYT